MGKILLSQWFVITVAVGLSVALASAQNDDSDQPTQRPAFQPVPRDRDRGEGTEDVDARPREGGIPRGEVVTPDGEAEEGTEEGQPQLRATPDNRRVAPLLVPPERRRWRLGVFAYNTDTGVVVTRLLPNSAARQAGLERGDRIVAVEGLQVGWVNDRLYPLGEELQRRAGRGGYVSLLIQNVRNQRLVNVGVDLDRFERVNGRDRDRFERDRERDRFER
jgi:hypothetical protein